jgi:hypothetical protein
MGIATALFGLDWPAGLVHVNGSGSDALFQLFIPGKVVISPLSQDMGDFPGVNSEPVQLPEEIYHLSICLVSLHYEVGNERTDYGPNGDELAA